MAWLFGTTIFLGAALLFWGEPMLAKSLLPALGGTPAVWNTCMVFYQAMLLGGYAYAHTSTNRLGLRRQTMAHAVLLLLGLLFLPMQLSEQWSESLATATHPAGRLLLALLTLAGLPFFLISSTSPLLQRWFSTTGYQAAADPYFLYAAANLGSLAALLAYPVFIEPLLALDQQRSVWTAGYALLALLILVCAAQPWYRPAAVGPSFSPHPDEDHPAESAPDWKRHGRWLLLAFIPSSLMLGTTQYLVTDLASIPLLWIIPLGLYLLTFVLAFARRRAPGSARLGWWVALGALAAGFSVLTRATHPVWLLLLIHLSFLFCAALLCHRRLAEDRPSPRRLTEFYLWLALGGVLGGAFNALLAPLLFQRVAEYPLVMVLAVLVRPGPADQPRRLNGLDLLLPLLLGLATGGLALSIRRSGIDSAAVRQGLVFGMPAVAAFMMAGRPWRFGLALGAMFLGGWFYPGEHGATLHTERSFFGVSRVTLDPGGRFRRLVHGNTWHGAQSTDARLACEPLAYYHRTGPLGALFRAYHERSAPGSVGVIGLGTGSMAAYARPGELWTFYEIDPAVIRIAQDPRFFTYLQECSVAPVRIVPGDARVQLGRARPGEYGLLVVDAFSSDAIPVHLLTREALALYWSKLAPDGLLVCHVSNRYLDLDKVLGALARDAGLIGVSWDEWNLLPTAAADGKAQAHWAVLARHPEDLGRLRRDARWLPLEAGSAPVWRDDFTSLLGVFRWN